MMYLNGLLACCFFSGRGGLHFEPKCEESNVRGLIEGGCFFAKGKKEVFLVALTFLYEITAVNCFFYCGESKTTLR